MKSQKDLIKKKKKKEEREEEFYFLGVDNAGNNAILDWGQSSNKLIASIKLYIQHLYSSSQLFYYIDEIMPSNFFFITVNTILIIKNEILLN